jgi:hypothetical protein
MTQQPTMGQGLLIVEASRSHSDTRHTVGLLWTSVQPDAHTSTWQHYKTHKRHASTPLRRIRTRNPSKWGAADSNLRPGCHWDRQLWQYKTKLLLLKKYSHANAVTHCSHVHYIYLPSSCRYKQLFHLPLYVKYAVRNSYTAVMATWLRDDIKQCAISYAGWSKSLCAPDDYHPHRIDDLKMAITEYIRNVDCAILNMVFESTVQRVNKCLETGGGHFEDYL